MLCSRVTAASVSVGERFETTKLIDGVTECQLGAGNGNRKTHDDVTDDQKRKKTGAVAKRLDGSSCLVMITTTLCQHGICCPSVSVQLSVTNRCCSETTGRIDLIHNNDYIRSMVSDIG